MPPAFVAFAVTHSAVGVKMDSFFDVLQCPLPAPPLGLWREGLRGTARLPF